MLSSCSLGLFPLLVCSLPERTSRRFLHVDPVSPPESLNRTCLAAGVGSMVHRVESCSGIVCLKGTPNTEHQSSFRVLEHFMCRGRRICLTSKLRRRPRQAPCRCSAPASLRRGDLRVPSRAGAPCSSSIEELKMGGCATGERPSSRGVRDGGWPFHLFPRQSALPLTCPRVLVC